MLKWALIFLVVSLIAGGLGFTGIASGAARLSKVLFVLCFVIFLLLVGSAFLIGKVVL